MSEMMKASFFEDHGDADKVQTGEMEKPEAGEGEVLIRVEAAGVNPVDAAVLQGNLTEAIPHKYPLIPGWDVAGVVVERGFSARRFDEGDRVFSYARRPVLQKGTFAEYIALPESYLALAPESMSMEEAGGTPLTGLTAWQSLFDAGKLQRGQVLLILGASGGVGSMAIQLAKAKGAYVIAVASRDNHPYMKELGADHTVTYEDQHVGEAVREIAPEGVDLIYHCSRGDSLDQCMEAGILHKDGKLISITNSKPDVPEETDFQYVFVEPNASQLETLQELADDGMLKVHVSETFELDEVPRALRQIAELHTRGKLVITP